MNLQNVIDRVNSECDLVNQTGFLTDIKDVDVAASDTPAVFVFWGGDAVEGSQALGALSNQALKVDLSMLVVAPVPSGASDPLTDVRNQLFTALSGWSVDDDQLLYSGGSVESINGGLIQWRDNYQFTRYLRNIR